MSRDSLSQRLSQIRTSWTLVFQAAGDAADAATAARHALLHRYAGAVYRYLLGAVGDPDTAEELAQEFALRVLRGDFRHADPGRGHFRNYLKTALVHLVEDHRRSRRAWPGPLPPDLPEPTAPAPGSGDSVQLFLSSWREGLLDHTWEALAAANPAYHAVLLFRVENPDVPAAEMAERLAAPLGKPVTAAGVRKALQRAHAKFADLLLDEVARSLEGPTPELLCAELRDLDLLRYCRSALERRQGRGQGTAPYQSGRTPGPA
jgi:DNA-directed RNA polymerase specialized sigma24 family protein